MICIYLFIEIPTWGQWVWFQLIKQQVVKKEMVLKKMPHVHSERAGVLAALLATAAMAQQTASGREGRGAKEDAKVCYDRHAGERVRMKEGEELGW